MRVYLDTCVWCRPFDQPSPRIKREVQALRTLLRGADRGKVKLVGSPIIEMELEWLGNPEKREAAQKLVRKSMSEWSLRVPAEAKTVQRRLQDLGLAPMDALHIAWAAAIRCDVFITVDDGILKMDKQIELRTGLRVSDPAGFARGL